MLTPPTTPLRTALTAASIALLTSPAFGQAWLTPPPAPSANPVTAEKAVLGKILFWDEQLSSDGSTACGTCHIPAAGGAESRDGVTTVHPGPDALFGTADDIFGSPGVVGANAFGHFAPRGAFALNTQVTGRYAPSPITAGYFTDLFWDGRARSKFTDPISGLVVIQSGGGLESQSLGPLMSDVEMADEGRGFSDLTDRLARVRPLALASNFPGDVQAALAAGSTYPDLFEAAFGNTDITPVRIAFALATYQRTLVADQAPYDEFHRGNFNALTVQQERGMVLFEGVVACGVCHVPPLFTDDNYHSLALRPSSEDIGRQAITGDPADAGTFKTPSLRNVDLRRHWFHNGAPTITTLRETVELYGTGVGGGFDNLDPALNGIVLTVPQVDDLTEFMRALTDPRVAAETFPFDRPTLRFERAQPNPMPMGFGGVPGSSGAVPEVLVSPAPFLEADRFRMGVRGAVGGAFATVRLRLVDLGGFAGNGGALAVRTLPLPRGPIRLDGFGVDGGYGTWMFPLTSSPALLGLTLDAQWWIRDVAAVGGVARSEVVRLTVE